jgi:predicted nucleotidyltransferase
VIKSRDPEEIDRAVERYVTVLREKHPEIIRAIWFGSWVNGDSTPGSDVDLCLILKSSEKSIRERIPDYLPVGFPVGVDIFPYTEEEFRRLVTDSPGWSRAILSGREMIPGPWGPASPGVTKKEP